MNIETVNKNNEFGRNPNNVFRLFRKMKKKTQMLLEKGACEEMMEHFTLVRRIEQDS